LEKRYKWRHFAIFLIQLVFYVALTPPANWDWEKRLLRQHSETRGMVGDAESKRKNAIRSETRAVKGRFMCKIDLLVGVTNDIVDFEY
jgi:hypothetical protein